VLPHAAEGRFVEGRLRFGDGSDNAPFPSIVVVFKPGRQVLNASSYSTAPEQLSFDLAA
jgi:hypothetical protein